MQNLSEFRDSLSRVSHSSHIHPYKPTHTSLLQLLKMFVKRMKPSRKRKVNYWKSAWSIAMTRPQGK